MLQITKIQDAQPLGVYTPTRIDVEKGESDFLLIQVSPYIIKWRGGETQKVTEHKLKKLQSTYTWQTDF